MRKTCTARSPETNWRTQKRDHFDKYGKHK